MLLILWKVFLNIFRKKRDLSDQSRGGDKRKKEKEGSSKTSIKDRDVFGEGLESANCKLFYSTAWKI